jgi:hypothetical protein
MSAGVLVLRQEQAAALTPEQAEALRLWQSSPAALAAREELAKRQRSAREALLEQLAGVEAELAAKLPPLLEAQARAEAAIPPLQRQLEQAQLAYHLAYGERFQTQEALEHQCRRLKSLTAEHAPPELDAARAEFWKLRNAAADLLRERTVRERTLLGSVERTVNNCDAVLARQRAIDAAMAELERLKLDPQVTSANVAEHVQRLRDALPTVDP